MVSERIAKDGLRETLHPRHLPMLVKPKPWLSYDQGGYLYNRCEYTLSMLYQLLANKFTSRSYAFQGRQKQQTYLEHASALGNVELVYAGLDVLGSTPWKVNRNIFDVVLKVWNSGERLCKIPPAVYDQPEPEKPPNMNADIKSKSIYGTRLKAYMQALTFSAARLGKSTATSLTSCSRCRTLAGGCARSHQQYMVSQEPEKTPNMNADIKSKSIYGTHIKASPMLYVSICSFIPTQLTKTTVPW